MAGNLIAALLLLSLVFNDVSGKDGEDTGKVLDEEVTKLRKTLHKSYDIIRGINKTQKVSDQELLRKSAKEFIKNTEVLAKKTHNEVALDSDSLKLLKFRTKQDNIDLLSIQSDVYFLFKFLLTVTPDDYVCKQNLKQLKNLTNDITIINQNKQNIALRKRMNDTRTIVANSIITVPATFKSMGRRAPKGSKEKLIDIYENISSTHDINQAATILQDTLSKAEDDYKQIYWGEYKEEIKDIYPDIPNSVESMENSVYLMARDLRRLEKSGQNDEDVLKKSKSILKNVVKEFEKLKSSADIERMDVLAHRVQTITDHLESRKQLDSAISMLTSSLDKMADKYYTLNARDEFIITLRTIQTNFQKLIEEGVYSTERSARWLNASVYKTIDYLQEVIWRLASHYHVRGYGEFNNKLQDIQDQIKSQIIDKKTEKKHIETIIKEINIFLKKNKKFLLN